MRSRLGLRYSRTDSDKVASASHPHLAFCLSAFQSTNKHLATLSHLNIDTTTNAMNKLGFISLHNVGYIHIKMTSDMLILDGNQFSKDTRAK